MTDTPSPTAAEDPAPIDAEFEPAEPGTSEFSRRGPGWRVVAGSVLAALIGLGVGAAALGLIPGLSPGGSDEAALKQEIAKLKVDLAAATADGNDLATRYEATKTEVNSLTRRLGEASRARGELNDRLSAIEADIKALAAQAQIAPTIDPDTGAPTMSPVNPLILDRIEALESAITSFPSEGVSPAPDTASLRSEITALRARLDALQAAPPPIPSATLDAEAALALAAIEAAARRGRPFQSGYQRLAAIMPDNTSVQVLGPLAAQDIPTEADLIDRFRALGPAALDAESDAIGPGASWMRGVFGDGITIRRTGEGSTAEILAQTEGHLDQGDLGLAIETIETLASPVQSVFTDWLDNARKREALEDALEALRLTMIAKDRP